MSEQKQRPMNERRWLLALECGHEYWITRARRPRAHKAKCLICATKPEPSTGSGSPEPKPQEGATGRVRRTCDGGQP